MALQLAFAFCDARQKPESWVPFRSITHLMKKTIHKHKFGTVSVEFFRNHQYPVTALDHNGLGEFLRLPVLKRQITRRPSVEAFAHMCRNIHVPI